MHRSSRANGATCCDAVLPPLPRAFALVPSLPCLCNRQPVPAMSSLLRSLGRACARAGSVVPRHRSAAAAAAPRNACRAAQRQPPATAYALRPQGMAAAAGRWRPCSSAAAAAGSGSRAGQQRAMASSRQVAAAASQGGDAEEEDEDEEAGVIGAWV